MHILCIYSRHHMGWIIADLNFLQEATGHTIEHKETLAMPLRLIDVLLVMTRPHIVSVIHLLGRKRYFLFHLPVFPHIDHRHSAGVGRAFGSSLLILCIDPDFAYSRSNRLLSSRNLCGRTKI